ncbi:MAG: phosphoribosyl 1,2-cyclic phosphate phosphodiesterase [Candidatus Sumerlaeota bacterium]|nr:phosphoribosyl 1,2-cyclic phosphate phosphodiesterase [Candidatus Sumerlaeota bacterium]
MIATILGSGTSTGVPPIGCTHPTCLSTDPKNKRLRAGLLLREGPGVDVDAAQAFIVDCGPDYRQQALTHRINRLDGVLLTHSHFDHVAGIDDLRLYNFRQRHALPVYGNALTLDDIRTRFHYVFDPPQQGGGVASLDLHVVTEPFVFLGQRIVPIPVKHGMLDILGYRFGDFVFVTDASEIPPESMDLMRDCRVLVLNALRPEKHSTHFSLDEAVEVAREINAQQTYFVHMTHYLEHHETNAMLPAGMELSYDGMSFEFQPEYVE